MVSAPVKENGPVLRLLTAWSAVVEKTPSLFAFALLAVIAFSAAAQASLKPFWYDELANYDVARLPSLSAVWSFFASGLDTPGPLPTLVQYEVAHHFGNGEVVNRLPIEAGFLLMCLCLYLFVIRRYSASFALVALLIPVLSGVFYYASEMRAYGFVLGGISLGLVCWQRAQSPGWRPLKIAGLFLGLSFAVGCHVYAIFAVMPFLLAQLVLERQTGKRDYAVWLAILLCPIWFLIEFPGMRMARKYYAGNFWSKPHPSQLLESYAVTLGLGWMISILFALLLHTFLSRRYKATSDASPDSGFSRAEWTLALGLALLPFFALPLSYLLGVFVPRYVMSVSIGMALVVVGAVAEAVRRNRIFASALMALLALVFLRNEHVMLAQSLRTHSSLTVQAASQGWVKAVRASTLPVLAPNSSVYLPMQYYASPDLEQRLFYTLHTPETIRLSEDPGNELNMKLFSQRIPLRVMEFSTFAEEHPKFLVVLESPLVTRDQPNNLKVELVGIYKPDEAFGHGQFAVYQVSTGSGN